MTIARKTFQIAFWETDDTSGRPALQIEHETWEAAQVDIAGQLREANYRIAALYQWNEAERVWREVELFNSQELPLRIH